MQVRLFQEEVNEATVQFAGVVLGIATSENILPILPPADKEGRVKIWFPYSNCLDAEKEVPLRQDGIDDLRSWI